MTVSNQTYRTSAVGSGAAGQEVPFTFPIIATTDLVVKKRVTATGAETTLTETTNYTVSINGSSGGTVTTVTAIETTEEIHIYRLSPRTQTQALTQGGTFSASVVMGALDKLTRIVTDLQGQIDQCIKFPRTDASTLDPEIASSIGRASKYLTFDSNGEPTATTEKATGSALISAFGETLIDDADAATARATLGLDNTLTQDFAGVRTKGHPWHDVTAYGATGDGVTDDTAAIQAAIQAASDAGIAGTNNGSSGVRASTPVVYFPKGVYVISETLDTVNSYMVLLGSDAIIQKTTGSFTGTYAFSADGNGWRNKFSGLQIQDFDGAIYLNSNNVNSGQIIIEKCNFFNNTTAITTDCASSIITIKDCIFRSNVHELIITTGSVYLTDCWISRGVLTDDYDGGIVLNGGGLIMNNMLGVPTAQTVTEPCWIKNVAGYTVVCTGCRFGGETGQGTVVNNYVVADLSSPYIPNGVILKNCGVYVGANTPAVRLFAIPNVMSFQNNAGYSSAGSVQVDWSATIDGAAQTAAIAALGSPVTANKVYIEIINDVVTYDLAVPDNLMFLVSQSPRQLGFFTYDATNYPTRILSEIQDLTITAGEAYGTWDFCGYDATAGASGIRAKLRVEATGTAGDTQFVLSTAPASGAVADIMTLKMGAQSLGADGTRQGTLTLWDGAGGVLPGWFSICAAGGARWYFFVTTAGQLRYHNAPPTADTDGNPV